MQERLAAVEKSSEEVGQQHRKEMSRLEAALTGAEAAKKQLGAQQAQHSTAGKSDLQAANAAQAEADARASSLQRQIDTLRAQAAASRSGLQDEANSLKARSLSQFNPPCLRFSKGLQNVHYVVVQFRWNRVHNSSGCSYIAPEVQSMPM